VDHSTSNHPILNDFLLIRLEFLSNISQTIANQYHQHKKKSGAYLNPFITFLPQERRGVDPFFRVSTPHCDSFILWQAISPNLYKLET